MSKEYRTEKMRSREKVSDITKPGLTRIRRISAIMRKEISNLISDKVAVLILFIIPVVMICIVGSSQISSNLTAVTIWVIDEDNSTVSHEALLTFENTSLADMGIQGTNIYIQWTDGSG